MPRSSLYYKALPLWLAGKSYKDIATALGLNHRQHEGGPETLFLIPEYGTY